MKLSLIILTLLILDANGINIPDYCWIFFGCSVAVNTFFNWLDIKYFNPRLPRGRRRTRCSTLTGDHEFQSTPPSREATNDCFITTAKPHKPSQKISKPLLL